LSYHFAPFGPNSTHVVYLEKTDNKARRNSGITWAQVVRDVLIASMNKGQFPIAIVSFIIILLIIKMPAADVSKLVFSILDELENGKIMGWFLFGTSVLSWFAHARWQRKQFTYEIDRLSVERNKAQQRNFGPQMGSSRRK
jgi:hypothetical protein